MTQFVLCITFLALGILACLPASGMHVLLLLVHNVCLTW